jgi:hypothetical protein
MEKVFAKLASIKMDAIRDTIFSRSPLLFTLFLVLDSTGAKIESSKLENAIFEIDTSFNSDTPVTERRKEDADFYLACTSNMHRIKSRQVRERYLKKYLL